MFNSSGVLSSLSFRERRILPVQQNHLLWGFIHTQIRNMELHAKCDNQWFSINGGQRNTFTFSRVFRKFGISQGAGSTTFFTPVPMTVSSIVTTHGERSTNDIVMSHMNVIQNVQPPYPATMAMNEAKREKC